MRPERGHSAGSMLPTPRCNSGPVRGGQTRSPDDGRTRPGGMSRFAQESRARNRQPAIAPRMLPSASRHFYAKMGMLFDGPGDVPQVRRDGMVGWSGEGRKPQADEQGWNLPAGVCLHLRCIQSFFPLRPRPTECESGLVTRSFPRGRPVHTLHVSHHPECQTNQASRAHSQRLVGFLPLREGAGEALSRLCPSLLRAPGAGNPRFLNETRLERDR